MPPKLAIRFVLARPSGELTSAALPVETAGLAEVNWKP
jgi:hypothetical protein